VTALIQTWAPRVGVAKACRAFGMPERTFHHRLQVAQGRLAPVPSRAKPSEEHTAVPWRIPDNERDHIKDVLCSERFGDLAPAQVYATLLDECQWPLVSPHRRPRDLPANGHQISPRTVMGSPRVTFQVGSGITPFPWMASARRTDSPSVTTMWAWCIRRSTSADAMLWSMS